MGGRNLHPFGTPIGVGLFNAVPCHAITNYLLLQFTRIGQRTICRTFSRNIFDHCIDDWLIA